MFSANQGDYYFDKVILKDNKDTTLAVSCVQDSKTGDVILKMVNFSNVPKSIKINLAAFKNISTDAVQTILSGAADAENTLENSKNVTPIESNIKIGKTYEYAAPTMSLTVFRIKAKR
jgi:alpha-L-arabinofuranosidase